MRCTTWVLGMALVLLGVGASGRAAAEEKRSGSAFDVMPYAWLPSTAGTVQVKDRTASMDVPASDLLPLLLRNAFAMAATSGRATSGGASSPTPSAASST